MKKFLSALAAASLAATLAACQSERPQPATNYPSAPAAQPSAAPVVTPPPAVATAGALAQAGVGKYMDAQEAELRARLKNSGVGVVRRGNDILLTIPNDKLFAGMELSSSGRSLLNILMPLLRKYDHTQVQVNGYTDTAGDAAKNLDVSQKRAALVVEALTGAGVAEARTEAHGFGATNLKVMTGDHVNEPRNRRIEMRIVPRPG